MYRFSSMSCRFNLFVLDSVIHAQECHFSLFFSDNSNILQLSGKTEMYCNTATLIQTHQQVCNSAGFWAHYNTIILAHLFMHLLSPSPHRQYGSWNSLPTDLRSAADWSTTGNMFILPILFLISS